MIALARLGDPRLQPADAAAADRNGVVVAPGKLHQLAIAVSPMADHPVDVDDVAAVDANEPILVEARFHFADGQRTEQLARAVEHVCVMGVGMDRNDVFDGYELCRAVALRFPVRSEPRVPRCRWQALGPGR